MLGKAFPPKIKKKEKNLKHGSSIPFNHGTRRLYLPGLLPPRHHPHPSLPFCLRRRRLCLRSYGPCWYVVEHLYMSELLGRWIVDPLCLVHRIGLLDLLHAILDKPTHCEPINMSSKIIKMANNEVTRMDANTMLSGAG